MAFFLLYLFPNSLDTVERRGAGLPKGKMILAELSKCHFHGSQRRTWLSSPENYTPAQDAGVTAEGGVWGRKRGISGVTTKGGVWVGRGTSLDDH